jgi:hypothetical protein
MSDDYDPAENSRKSYEVAIDALRAEREADEYRKFLAKKAPKVQAVGLTKTPKLHEALKPHQRDCVEFALKQGRAGLFLDTGLGKTFCELEFAKHALKKKALILTPLAVAKQIEREAQKFGFDARVIRDRTDAKSGINICNYDRLEKLDLDDFDTVVLDESSILKSFGGKTSQALIHSFKDYRFRLAATATPAPNDHMELGNHAEFLGIMQSSEMLMRWFVNDTETASQTWRLKGHATTDFWDWMASWSRMAETPADLGHDASEYILPEMKIIRHRVSGTAQPIKDGLFALTDNSATSMHSVKRETAVARAECIGALVQDKSQWIVWCDTDYEADALAEVIDGAIEVRGSMKPEEKEEGILSFVNSEARVLITKPSICGYGLNLQHVSNMAFVGRSFSYESWYQAVRRCWRFGQKNIVNVHLAVAEGEDQIGRIIDRKTSDHQNMKRAMSEAMRRAAGRKAATKVKYEPKHKGRLPSWLYAA